MSAKRVMIVEDEALIAVLLEEMLGDLGYEVIGPFASVATALAMLAKCKPDAAILDVHLAGESSIPLAEALREEAVPFAFSTGDAPDADMDALSGFPILSKPYRVDDLYRTMEQILPAKSVISTQSAANLLQGSP